MHTHRRVLAEILALAREIEPWTIEKITATTAELGADTLYGRFGGTDRYRH